MDIAAFAETEVDEEVLAEAIRRLANHRVAPIQPLSKILDGFADPVLEGLIDS